MALPPKQALFVDEYLLDRNASQAAIRAGYSARTAYSQGQRLLKNVEVQQAISERVAATRNAMSLEEAIQELTKLARADMGLYATWGPDGVTLNASDDLPEGATVAVLEVSEITTKQGSNTRFKLHDKRGALEAIIKFRQWERETQDLEARITALEEKVNAQS